MNQSTSSIVCIGEILWDALPGGLFLGGAPLNVCYHLNRLGVEAEITSRVGDDRLGREAIRRMHAGKMKTELVQDSSKLETGFVEVELDEEGDAAYTILHPVAWDQIERLPEIAERVQNSWGLVYGSLAQRSEESRSTIQSLFGLPAKKIFDMNLRPPFDDREIVDRSLEAADIVKMNHEELAALIDWYRWPDKPSRACRELAGQFGCEVVCITRAASGAGIWRNGEWQEHPGFEIEVADTVGAGDAFLAGLVSGLMKGWDSDRLLEFANAAGAFIASLPGAMPDYRENAIAGRFGLEL